MSAFLFFLVKLNLAMAVAIILVALLRRPLRHLFSAPIAYAVWFLVPIAGAASFFPPRVVPISARRSGFWTSSTRISPSDFLIFVCETALGR